MHAVDSTQWRQNHDFDEGNPLGERNTRRVILLTAFMMVAEIVGGLLFNSMALLADGWHMGTHVAALGLTAFAYWYARRNATDTRFAFGTWKVGVLGGFASAIVLGLVAVYMAWESILRLCDPLPIRYEQAIVVAFIGLGVNLLSAFLLGSSAELVGQSEGAGVAQLGAGPEAPGPAPRPPPPSLSSVPRGAPAPPALRKTAASGPVFCYG